MVKITIVQMAAGAAPNKAAYESTLHELKTIHTGLQAVIGRLTEDERTVEILLEHSNESATESGKNQLLQKIEDSFGQIQKRHSMEVNLSPFSEDRPATQNYVEHVTTSFRASEATPDFRGKIEADFMRFNELIVTAASGRIGLSIGWTEEEVLEDIFKGEPAVSFFALVGWESMQKFQDLMATDTAKEALPILLGWNAPYKMWFTKHETSI